MKKIHTPLFAGYVFIRAHLTPEVRLQVLRVPGLIRFVSSGREPSPIPEDEIESVRRLLLSGEAFECIEFLVKGQKVRIHGGVLEGVEGVLVEYRQCKELVISVGAIERSLRVKLGTYDVEAI
jgi:transcription antitermination factor NusG